MDALAVNCSLKGEAGEESSTQLLLSQIMETLGGHGAGGTILRAVDRDIRPGVTSDEGDGDGWPAIRRSILAADILVLGTPIWLGQPSSVCQRVLERMDAFLGEKDDEGRMPSYGRVALVAVVGNEDGAHHVSAQLYQALNDVGFTLAANAVVYWVGEAMGGIDYKELAEMPDAVGSAMDMAVSNAVHLARLLVDSPYGPTG
jgi:multimeric flavodoxin WrbA